MKRNRLNRTCSAAITSLLALTPFASTSAAEELSMDKMWGDQSVQKIDTSERTALFRDGNYGMFIHIGLFSKLGGQWKDQTFYGIGEWIKRQMKINDDEYRAIAIDYDLTDFNAEEIVKTAKAAGMKWIIITAKHHEGFAMFKSATKDKFNIVDATPFARDPMRELADACRKAGLGFGFYYSHNQDWIAPGGNGGPGKNPDGSPATFEQYFREKCRPQVEELCTNYGPLDFIWFDTPGGMPKECVMDLAELVRKTQPKALLCSRIGYGMGDYSSLGDMEVPIANASGLWETCDTTNDSWSYAWYDQNWKDSREITHRLVSTVARGGTYLLNVGPDATGRIPAPAVKFLKGAGEWVARHPEVVYSAAASPWGRALPWGDVTVSKDGTLNLVVFDRPEDGILRLPGLRNQILAAQAKIDGKIVSLNILTDQETPAIQLPAMKSERPAEVFKLKIKGTPEVDKTLAVFPNMPSHLPVAFAKATGAHASRVNWMEKFGEWKCAHQVSKWTEGGKIEWTIDVTHPGDYKVEMSYRGPQRTVWDITTDEGFKLRNQQNASPIYQFYPYGLLTFTKPGRHTISVSLSSGNRDQTSLESIRLTPAE